MEEEWKSRAQFFHPGLGSSQQNSIELQEANLSQGEQTPYSRTM